MIRSRSKCMPSIVLLVLIGTEEWTEKDKLNYVNWTLKSRILSDMYGWFQMVSSRSKCWPSIIRLAVIQ